MLNSLNNSYKNSVNFFSFPPSAATFGIKNVIIDIEDTGVTVNTVYFEDTSASGAFFVFVSLNLFGVADLENAKYLALDRKTSLNFTLPFNLSAGRTIVLVYDIESHGSLSSGTVYPAVYTEVAVIRSTTSGIF